MENQAASAKTWPLYAISRFRGVLLGAAALWIAWYHSYMHFYAVPPLMRTTTVLAVLLNTVRGVGDAGVDIFLLMSGLGLYFSFENTPKLPAFYKKRALRVLPPFLIVSVIWNGMNGSGGFLNYFKRVFLLDFFTEGNTICWYVNLLIILYLFYPLLHRFVRSRGVWAPAVLIAASVALALAMRFLTPVLFSRIFLAVLRLPVFICGVWLGKMVYEKRTVSRGILWAAAAVFAVCWIWYVFLNLKQIRPDGFFARYYPYCPFAVSTVLLGSAFFSRFSLPNLQSVLSWFGTLAFEIYLLFERTAMTCKEIFPVDDRMHIVYYFPVFMTVLLLAVALQQVCKMLRRTVFDKADNSKPIQETQQ